MRIIYTHTIPVQFIYYTAPTHLNDGVVFRVNARYTYNGQRYEISSTEVVSGMFLPHEALFHRLTIQNEQEFLNTIYEGEAHEVDFFIISKEHKWATQGCPEAFVDSGIR